MRAYFFGNMYLSSIQQGIQAAHVVAEMGLEYGEGNCEIDSHFLGWARDHKTMVLLNAGYSDEIRSLVDFFGREGNPYPWAFFNEGQDALDGALTCVGIILPEKIYELSKLIRDPDEFKIIEHRVTTYGDYTSPIDLNEVWEYTKWEWDLVVRLNQYGLAK